MRGASATLAGTVVGGILASICCVGPLVLALVGVGVGGALLAFEPYRPYFLVVTASLLGTAFYLVYRRPSEVCADGEICATSANRRRQAAVLWIVTAFVILATVG